MQRLLKIYNKKESLNKENLPESNNRSFSLNSSIKGIHIGRAKPKLRHSMIDQAFLEQIIEEWRNGNNNISVHFDQNLRTWKNKTKRGLSFLLSANLAKISPQ